MAEYVIGHVFAKAYPPDAAIWCDNNNAHIEPLADGGYVIVANDPQSIEQTIKLYENAVQDLLDTTANGRGYDNTYTCLSYISSTNSKFAREANAFNVWRDSVWVSCHNILNDFMAGKIEQPTIEEVIAAMPAFNWGE